MRALFLLLALFAALPAAAQSPRATVPGIDENRREVRQMAEVLEIIPQAEALMARMRQEIIASTQRTSELTAEQAAAVVDEILMPNFVARSAELVEELLEPYALNLTISDLKALRSFYASPLGQKFLRAQKLSRKQGETAGLAWGQRVFQESVDRHADELRARGLKF
jgi:hypothetical protein